MTGYVTCGALDTGNGFSDIVVNVETGDAVCCSDLLGDSLLSNVAVLDPIHFDNAPLLDKLCEHFDCDGVIMSGKHLITLKDNKAYYRNYGNNEMIEHVVDFDLNVSYDFE